MRNKIAYIETNGRIHNPDSCDSLETAWRNNKIELQTLARGTYPGKKLRDDELPGIKSIGFWDARTTQNWGLDWHRNEGIEICFLESGTLDFYLNNQSHALIPNMLTITRPWMPHKLGNPIIGLSKLHWFILDLNVRQPHQEWRWPDWIILRNEDLHELTDILRRNEKPVWAVGKDVKDSFIEIGKLITSNQKKFTESKIKIRINEIFIQLLEVFTFEKPVLNDSLIQSKRSVEMFLDSLHEMLHEQWTLDEMARYCGLGITQFSKYCYELTNATPINYLNQLRIKKARQLLINEPEKSITELAFECGFSSNQYFTNVFKRNFNLSPSHYRSKMCHQQA